jgi:signal transduction histidine kinase
MRARLEESAAAARRAERISWIVGAATLLLSVLVFAAVVRSISGALNRLQTGTRQVAGGNFEYRLAIGRGDEFAQLATDFNTMTRQLGELDRLKRSFLSKVSHDLKTPLASMQETVQVMLDGMAGPITDRQRRLLQLTEESARRLSTMIARILDLSAIEGGALVLEKRRHDVRELVRPAVEILACGEAGRHHRIVTDMPPTLLEVDCDHDRTIQVLLNLLENAAKFSPEGAEIRVSARAITGPDEGVPSSRWNRLRPAPGERVAALIEVADRGPGVPDSDKTRVFEDFFQSGGPRARGRGVGLGLAICRDIVELHGGTIWVRDNPGGGSTFAVLLPGANLGRVRVVDPLDAFEVSGT